jgi:anaerobic selenocysteine-containing dehydrogenase
LFSYSTDGTNWSSTIDDIMTGNISINGGGTVHFHVSPYFAGQTGTYLLDISLARTIINGMDKNQIGENVKIYPNPAKEFIMVDLNGINEKINHLKIVNLQGQMVYSSNLTNQSQLINVPLNNLSEGVYYLQIQTNNEIITKKIVVSK